MNAARITLAVLVCASACALGCSKEGALELRLLAPDGQNPFEGATVARLTIPKTSTTPLTIYDFAVSADGTLFGTLKPAPSNIVASLTVELLDAARTVVARGRTPPLGISSTYTGTVDILVGKVNSFGKLVATLPAAVSRPSAFTLREGEVLIAGGLDHATPLTKSSIYDLYFYEFQATATLLTARAAATVLPNSAGKFVLYGGLVGGGATGPTATELVEVYDATNDSFTGGQGGAGARVDAAVSPFPDATASWLVSGGSSGSGDVPLGTAVVFAESTLALTALPSPMTAPRRGHTMTTVQTPLGPRLFLYGGNATVDVERLVFDAELFDSVSRGFAPLPAPAALGRRRNHTASLLSDGRVLIAGGRDEAGTPRADLILYSPYCDDLACPRFAAAQDAQGQPLVLTGARYGHAAFALENGKMLIAAGRGAGDAPLKTAELFVYDAATKRLARDPSAPPVLTTPRADFAAVLLSTGQVLFAGGVSDSSNTPLSSAELYFPR